MFPKSAKALARYLQTIQLAPQKKWGQNFLIDESCHLQIAETAEVTESDVILEIGPGLGHLTRFLYQRAKLVIAVEIDPCLVEILKKIFVEPFAHILTIDALAKKRQINPLLLEALQPYKSFKLVANLPFNISAPLIVNFLTLTSPPQMMVVTVQKEIAEKLVATPGTSQYGALSVTAQVWGQITFVRLIPPHAFYPRPKVHSAVVKIIPNTERPAKIKNIVLFQRLVEALFGLRRKTMLNAIRHCQHFRNLSTSQLKDIISPLSSQTRGEALSIEELIDLANRFPDTDLKDT